MSSTPSPRAVELGRRAEADDRFAGVLSMPGVAEDGYWLTLAEVHPSWVGSQFGISLAFNADNPVDFLHVVWPDGTGRPTWCTSWPRRSWRGTTGHAAFRTGLSASGCITTVGSP